MGIVSKALEGKTLFITGATGFLGQPLVEKILWLAPKVNRLYVLIRPKTRLGKQVMSGEERLKKELLQSTVFDRLAVKYGKKIETFLTEKIIAVAGDVSESRLGLSSEIYQQLLNEVDIIINSAAVVSFDASLEDALELNALSAERIANFANACEGALLVHISTAYVSGAGRRVAPETIHHSSVPGEDLELYPTGKFTNTQREVEHLKGIISRIHADSKSKAVNRELEGILMSRARKSGRDEKSAAQLGRREALRNRWTTGQLTKEGLLWARKRGWHDTYTYTKALGEQLLVQRRKPETPTVIIRPSVIESSLAEPSPGWLDGLRMADPLIVAIGKGRLRSLPMNPKVPLDLVPVDMVVNALLATIPTAANQAGIRVYHVATGETNPISLGELYNLVHGYFIRNPMLDKAGRPIAIKRLKFRKPTAFRLQHKVKSIPLGASERALKNLSLSDSSQAAARKISARKAAFEKLYYYGEIYQPYLNFNCCFQTNNITQLFRSLGSAEQKLLNFDVTQLNWRHYIQNVHIPGLKKHTLKLEDVTTMATNAAPWARESSDLTIPELVKRSSEKFPHKTALQIKRKSGWERITYKELWTAAQQIGANLRAWGLQKGDRVVVYSENQPEWGLAYLGAVTVGLVVVPLDAQAWHKEVWAVARLTEARALLVSENCFEKIRKENLRENEQQRTPLKILNVDKHCEPFEKKEYPRSTYAEARPTAQPQPSIKPGDLASIIFTNSAAVDPKGAMHSHQNFIMNLLGVNCYVPVDKNDQVLSMLPLYHALEFACGFLLPLYAGATISYLHSLKPRVILSTMREIGVTCMVGVPTLYALLREDIERRVLKASNSSLRSSLLAASKSLSRAFESKCGRSVARRLFARVHEELGGRVKFFVSGGSSLGDELYEDFRALGIPIYEGYGLTETAPVLTVNPTNGSRRGSAGKPLPGVELRVFRPNRAGVGEIVVRTPCLMEGYYKNTRATEAVIKDGWFHTGDLGWVDVDGYIYVTGRSKDVIVTGAGKNVYPADLEAIYSSIPGVNDVCVMGVKSGLTEDIHGVFGVDLVELGVKDLAPAREALLRQVRGLARELPSYHRLQQVHVWGQGLPRDQSGRVKREKLEAMLIESIKEDPRAQLSAGSSQQENPNNREDVLLEELSRLSGTPKTEIKPESHLYVDLGLDSLMAIQLLLFVERRLGVQIEDQVATKLETVQQLVSEAQSATPSNWKPGSNKATKKLNADPVLPKRAPLALERFLQTASLSTLKVFYKRAFRLRVRGSEHIPTVGPCVIAANHASHLDAPAILSALDLKRARTLRVLGARDYFFDTRLKGWLFRTFLNLVPVEREETALAGLKMSKSLLEKGNLILIFPEGTRSRTGKTQPFKPGLGLIALEAGVPIVPAYIKGTHRAMPPGQLLPRLRPIEVAFASPIPMEKYKKGAFDGPRESLYRNIANDVQGAIAELARESALP